MPPEPEHRRPEALARMIGGEVMLVAGEASGDLHGAGLVRAMQRLAPNLRFCGMGGQELRLAGVKILYDAAGLAVVGVTEVLSHLGDIRRARRTLIERMRRQPPTLLILIDYPDFNLWLARTANKLGIPIFYYISPQLWAWRSGRVRTIRRLVDRMAVILPFEQEFYARHGLAVDFVGHPLVDTVRPSLDREQFMAAQAIAPDNGLVGLLPGSRRKEIAALLSDFLAGAHLLARESTRPLTFLIPLASTIDRSLLDQHGLAQWQGRLDVRVISDDRYSMMAACDAVVAASGTVMLELALLNVPAAAAYRTSRNTYLLGRLLIRHITHFTLVNLIGGRTIIPELLQDEITPERIAGELRRLLDDQEARQEVLAGLAEVRQRLGGPGASERAATIALAMLGEQQA